MANSTTDLERRPCKKCGCPLIFVVGPNGKPIPLDERSPTYSIGTDLTGQPTAVLAQAYVSHFKTCSFANDFSGGKKKR